MDHPADHPPSHTEERPASHTEERLGPASRPAVRPEAAEGPANGAAMAQALHRFTVEAYEEMGRVGLLPEKGVELVDGVVVEVSPHGPRHAFALVELNTSFVEQCRGRYRVWPNCLSLPLGPRDMPDPDLVLSRVDCDIRPPTPAQVFLIVEISDSSLKYDLGSKRARYARAGIAEYWVVDLVHDELRAFADPDRERGEYRGERRCRPGDEAAPSAFPDVRIDVARGLGCALTD